MKCNRILAVLDFSENTGSVLDYTMELASKEKAELCLVHPEPPQSGFVYLTPTGPGYSGFLGFGNYVVTDKDIQSVTIEHDKQALELLKEKMEQKGIKTSAYLLRTDSVSKIVEKADEFEADMIIIGGHQQGFFADLVLGNPEKALIKKANCPVLIIPEKKSE